jgi:predicted N-formylglutamate amidohydrolase
MVLGLDPNNNVLWDHFDSIIDHAINTMTEVPESIIERSEKFDPRARLMKKVFKLIRKHRGKSSMSNALIEIRTLINNPRLRKARQG